MAEAHLTPIEVGLTAAIVAVEAEEPRILVAADPKGGIRAGLPFGPFDPLAHRTFEIGLRNWVAAQTAINVGYVEQLYTFGDRGRHARPDDTGVHMISVGYLALTRCPTTPRRSAKPAPGSSRGTASFPGRTGATAGPAILDQTIVPLLEHGPRPASASRAAARPRASGCGIASPSAARPGTRRRCSTATSCCTRPGWSRRRAATAARPPCRAASCRRSARRCASTTAGSWRPPSRGCAPS